MATLTTEDLDVNTGITESVDGSMPQALVATPYFEDYLFKIIADLNAINDELVSGAVTDGANVGGFTELFQEKNGTILEFRTIQSSDGSVTITQNADDIDLAAAQLSGTVANSILTYNLGTNEYTELPQFRVSFSGGVITITQDDGGGGSVTMLTSDGDGQTGLFNDGTEVANTRAALSGGLFVNNLDTGLGFERVLTTGDLGGGVLPVPTVNNAVLHADLPGGAFVELSTLTMDVNANVLVIDVEDAGAAFQPVITADADGQMIGYFDGTAAVGTQDQGIQIYDTLGGSDPQIEFLDTQGGTSLAQVQLFGNDFFFDNRVVGGDFIWRASDVGITDTTVMQYDQSATQLIFFFDNDAVSATESRGLQIVDPNTQDPTINFRETIDGTLLALMQSFGGDMFQDNRVNSGTYNIRGRDSVATAHNFFVGDPDDSVDLSFDGTAYFSTNLNGARVNSDAFPQLEFTSADQLTSFGFIFYDTGAGALTVRSQPDSSHFIIAGRDAVPATVTMVDCDPDDSVQQFFDAALATLTTAEGSEIRDTAGTVPTLDLANDSGTVLGSLRVNTTEVQLRNEVIAGHVVIQAIPTAGSLTDFIEIDPDTGIGFNASAPIAQPDYTITNPTTDRSFDANAAAGAITNPPTQAEVENIRDAVLELADVVGTIAQDLIDYGLFQ